jgi:tRNA A22 N-methylase
MGAQNIKTLLHESIENINDEDFLLAVKQILDRKYLPSDQPQLSKEQIQRIEESKQQIKQGNFLTNEQADKIVEKWLNE